MHPIFHFPCYRICINFKDYPHISLPNSFIPFWFPPSPFSLFQILMAVPAVLFFTETKSFFFWFRISPPSPFTSRLEMQITCDGGLTFCIYTGRLFVRVADCWRLSELVYFSSSYSREMNGSHSPSPPTAPSDYVQVRFWCIRLKYHLCPRVFFCFHPSFILFPQMSCLLKGFV